MTHSTKTSSIKRTRVKISEKREENREKAKNWRKSGMLERDPESAGEFEWKKIGKKEREKNMFL